MILSLKNIKKSYGAESVLENVSFVLNEKDKLGIVGVNGAGKTTLFKIITGEISFDSGEITMPKDLSIGYLKQNSEIEGSDTVYGEMLKVFNDIIDLESEIRFLENEMSSLSGDALKSCMEKYSSLSHNLEALDGYSYKSRLKGVLKGLGFGEDDYEKPISFLSGGEKTRLNLGRFLLMQPSLLLLDEPTNHLDIDSVEWLEDYLRSYQGQLIIISHDRYFLDKVITRTVEIENKYSSVYEGNYTWYATEKEKRRRSEENRYINQQKEIKRQEEIITKLRSFNREKSIKRAESREKNLLKIENLDKPLSSPDIMHISLSPKFPSGNDVLFAESLSKSFDGKRLFENVSLDIKRGERIAVIGPNGIGKTTLIKIFLGEIKSDSGICRFGTNVNIGYYDQSQQILNSSKTVFSEISDSYPEMTSGEIRNTLAAFVFTGEDVFKEINTLSGGERGRLSLAKIMLSKANLLVLDEPTNHLDMQSKEILENALRSYEGTVLYISHDRYFINRTATVILEMTPFGLNKYLGDYNYYLEKKSDKKDDSAVQKEDDQDFKTETGKENWLKQKEETARARKKQNAIQKTEQQIEETEKKIRDIETMLFDKSVHSDAEKTADLFNEKLALEKKLASLYEKWEEAQNMEI
ncbi:MAG: ABC-F family ATP-binding cassette domain-containing protein [Lachnospiraceae bacterium]|nr:ABC-F family ATP-binding cassette domain-containing protein [Lachnospiraceae bacterium]